ncbi:MAG: carboxylesterase family protein [Planctomycetota bacterium]
MSALRSIAALSVVLAFAAVPVARAQDQGDAQLPAEIIARDWVVIEPVDKRGRRPFRPEAVFAAHLLSRDAPTPKPGDKLTGEYGEERMWFHLEADEAGNLGGQSIGWAYAGVHSDVARVMMAELSGASTLFVNGEGFVGDVYRAGFGVVPVALREGENQVYVNGVRGSFRFRLTTPDAPLILSPRDYTVPDLVAGADSMPYADRAGLLFMNASTEPILRLSVTTQVEGEALARAAPGLHGLPPLGIAKVPAWASTAQPPPAGAAGETRALTVTYGGHRGEEPREQNFKLKVVEPTTARRHVLTSAVDDSVQVFSVLPPAPVATADDAAPRGELAAGGTLFDRPRLVLTLHGAGVGSMGQVRSYSAKPGAWIVAPTNRRPFGFDWQDWGRLDAYEVLDAALEMSGADPATVGLTGHSMGGHGTWHLGANDPDRFAAIAPSAGWASFDSYGGRPEGELREVWHAADAASNSLALIDNLKQLPTFILHGTADDNVPASEARAMEAALIEAGATPHSHYQEGAGHWWNGSEAAGADCVDWPDLFALLLGSRVPSTPIELDWTTVDPGVDSRHHWLSASQPLQYGEPMHLRAVWNIADDAVTVWTRNARRIGIRWPGSTTPETLILDGQEFDADALATTDSMHAAFRNTGDRWFLLKGGLPLADRLDEQTGAGKTPGRSGPFKRAFDRGFVLVYGTAGEPDEDAELLARARYDSSVWWYRANGHAPVISDTEFLDPIGSSNWARKNVILYGNADTNAAWDHVLDERCPVRATRGRIALGETSWEGDGLGAVFVFPRKGEPGTLVGAFADTGVSGTRLGYALSPFISGVGYPDYTVFGGDILHAGDGGVLAAGWFDADWTLRQEPAVLR